MKDILWLLLIVSNIALAQSREYPLGPVARLTPGQLCTTPNEHRYPEQIAYCERNVSSEQKEHVFSVYRQLGFTLNPSTRSSYKIDHFIPLCAGGANTTTNLWPQHISIANVTDSIEKLGCDKMAAGRLTQARFISLLRMVKNDLRYAPNVTAELSRL